MITVSFRQCGDKRMQMFLSGCSQMRCHYPGPVSDLLFSARLLNWVTVAPGCKPALCECRRLPLSRHLGNWGDYKRQTITFPAFRPRSCSSFTLGECCLQEAPVSHIQSGIVLLTILLRRQQSCFLSFFVEDAMLNLHS